MRKLILLLVVMFTMTSCYTTYKTPNRSNGLRPLWYSPRTHYGPFYKHPRPKQMRPHFNPRNKW